MLTFEEYQKRKEGYLKAIKEFDQMIEYRTAFLKNISGEDDVTDFVEHGWWNENTCIKATSHRCDKDLVIRSLRFLIEFNQFQLRYLDDTLEDPGAAEDIVNSWLDSANHKYEFKFDGEED